MEWSPKPTEQFSKEEIKRNFSEERLASLSLEDYIKLLRQFPGEMVAHVVRQGIRDHSGHMDHTQGVGEYSDGFMRMVADGRLRPPLGVYLAQSDKKQGILNYLLSVYKPSNKEEALHRLSQLTTSLQGENGSYADRMAVHFATEEVADAYYGSERGNEIFVAYPSAHIASQYYFSGQLTQTQNGDYWNDRWVWANEERGMDLNSGVVFIPEETKVDPETGSRYQLDQNKNPITNSENQIIIRRFIDSPNFSDFAKNVKHISYGVEKQESAQRLKPLRLTLEREFGITDERLQSAILDYDNIGDLQIMKYEEGRNQQDLNEKNWAINKILKEEGIFYIEAQNAVNSKQFWERYFTVNPEKRPSKIVYYKGTNPTQALLEWRKEQGINKRSNEKDLGFPEKNIDRDAPQATAGLEEFKVLAQEAVEDYFK